MAMCCSRTINVTVRRHGLMVRQRFYKSVHTVNATPQVCRALCLLSVLLASEWFDASGVSINACLME